MVRKFIRVACFNEVTVVRTARTTEDPTTVKGSVIHTVRAEDTFFNEPSFLNLMQLKRAELLISENSGVTVYQHRLTTDACSMGVVKRFSFTIRLVDGQTPSPRFGVASKITQPAYGQLTKEVLRSNCGTVTFTLDGGQYKIDPNTITEVGGKKYK